MKLACPVCTLVFEPSKFQQWRAHVGGHYHRTASPAIQGNGSQDAPAVVPPEEIGYASQLKALQAMASIRQLQEKLTPQSNGEVERLRIEIAEMKRDRELAAINSKLETLSARVETLGTRREDGSSSSLSDKIVTALLPRILEPPPNPIEAGRNFLGALKDYAGALHESSASDIEALALQLRYKMFEASERDRLENAARETATMSKLMDLGQTVLKDTLQPITQAAGDGIRQRVAQGAPVTTPTPKPFPSLDEWCNALATKTGGELVEIERAAAAQKERATTLLRAVAETRAASSSASAPATTAMMASPQQPAVQDGPPRSYGQVSSGNEITEIRE